MSASYLTNTKEMEVKLNQFQIFQIEKYLIKTISEQIACIIIRYKHSQEIQANSELSLKGHFINGIARQRLIGTYTVSKIRLNSFGGVQE